MYPGHPKSDFCAIAAPDNVGGRPLHPEAIARFGTDGL